MSHNRIFAKFRQMFPKYYNFAKESFPDEEIWEKADSNSIIIKIKRNLKLVFIYNNKFDWKLITYNRYFEEDKCI